MIGGCVGLAAASFLPISFPMLAALAMPGMTLVMGWVAPPFRPQEADLNSDMIRGTRIMSQ